MPSSKSQSVTQRILSGLLFLVVVAILAAVYINPEGVSTRLLRMGGGIVSKVAMRPNRALAALAVFIVLVWSGIGISAMLERRLENK